MTVKKVTFFILAFFVALLCSTSVFAKDDNAIRDAGSSIANVTKDAGATIKSDVENAGSGIRNGMENAGNAVKDGAGKIENSMVNGLDKATGAINGEDNNTDRYVATRTNTQTGGFMGMGPMAWTWFSLALAGTIIVALVWYYGTQNDTHHNPND